MRHFHTLAAALLASLVMQGATAADKTCAPLCSSDKQACRADAGPATDLDTAAPLASMPARTNPNAMFNDKVESRFEQQRPTAAQDFRKRRADRLQACDAAYRRCAAACDQQ